MAIDWRLAGQGFNALEVLNAAGQGRREAYTWNKLAREEEAAQRALGARQAVSGAVGRGDWSGAARTAASVGDFDLVKSIQGLRADDQKRLGEELKVAGGAAAGLRALPQAQRMAALNQYRPALNAAGLDDREIEQYIGDLSDGVLDGIINTTSTAEQVLSRNEPKYIAVGENGIVDVRNPQAVAQFRGGQGGSTSLEQQAQEAIAAGADPAAVYARMRQMGGGPAATSGSFPRPLQGSRNGG